MLENNAQKVVCMVTHAILSKNAIEKLNNSKIDKLVCTNSLPIQEKLDKCSKMETLDISATLAEAIRRLHNGESVSYLFNHVPE